LSFFWGKGNRGSTLKKSFWPRLKRRKKWLHKRGEGFYDRGRELGMDAVRGTVKESPGKENGRALVEFTPETSRAVSTDTKEVSFTRESVADSY